jgi:hypothetical protein
MLIEDYAPTDVEWCEICRQHNSGECDACHSQFEPGETKYRSSSHHFHPGSVAGEPGMLAIHKELCVDCYRADFRGVYRKDPPPLPDRGADPRHWHFKHIAEKRREMFDLARGSELSPEDQARLNEVINKAIQ